LPAGWRASCENCGGSFSPARPHQRFCSDSCRWRRFEERRQKRLDFAPAPQPVPTDPAVQPEARPRLTRQAREIYELLCAGPASEADLREATGSKRVAARIYDIKRWLKYEKSGMTVKSKTDSAGCCIYRLEAR
jgi:hypothetical protein